MVSLIYHKKLDAAWQAAALELQTVLAGAPSSTGSEPRSARAKAAGRAALKALDAEPHSVPLGVKVTRSCFSF